MERSGQYEARLIAQVISGVGFLGAGTIIVTKQSVTGLTTAASLWAIAGVGIAIGMGFYAIAIIKFYWNCACIDGRQKNYPCPND